MKKLLILLFLIPIIGFSQDSDVFGSTFTRPNQIKFGNYNTFQGVNWRDRLTFQDSIQDKIFETRSRNHNRTHRIGRPPSHIRKMKWRKYNRQRQKSYNTIYVWK